MSNETNKRSILAQLPRGVWALGFVSLFMDISSEMIHALLPLYLAVGLGASVLTIGIIEGIAEATALIVKIFSGAISDWIGKRKLLAVIGYGLAVVTKPVFPLASTLGWIVAARFVDRVGKGIRGAPRDALVADITPAPMRGAAYGLRQSLDTVGAFLGPLLAIVLMAATSDDFRFVFWVAIIPAGISLVILLIFVKEPKQHRTRDETAGKKPRLKLAELAELPRALWTVIALSSLMSLARFSEAFLVLRAENVGLSFALVPLILVIMSAAYALSAYPAGALSDRAGRKPVLIVGLILLIIGDLLSAIDGSIAMVLGGVVFWGLHMGFTQGIFAAMVADAAPQKLRGTAFGLLNLASGIALLAASVIAGLLWDIYGPAATFITGAIIASLVLAGQFWVLRDRKPQ